MKLKNILIVVDNIEESIHFYNELFGLNVISRQEGNVIMSEGLVLQDAGIWKESTAYRGGEELLLQLHKAVSYI